jgi:hypothetical protein
VLSLVRLVVDWVLVVFETIAVASKDDNAADEVVLRVGKNEELSEEDADECDCRRHCAFGEECSNTMLEYVLYTPSGTKTSPTRRPTHGRERSGSRIHPRYDW